MSESTLSHDNKVKIVFKFHSDLLDEYTVETVWADVVNFDKGYFKIDNIPFYAPLIASDDIIYAQYEEEEQRFVYRETVEPSGNSTIQVVIMSDNIEINQIRDKFKTLGCESEKVNEIYFVMEVPLRINYAFIQSQLIEFTEKGYIEYAEPCLSNKHIDEIETA